MNENKRDDKLNKQQQGNQQRPQDLEPQGEQKGAQQIPSSQRDNDVKRQ